MYDDFHKLSETEVGPIHVGTGIQFGDEAPEGWIVKVDKRQEELIAVVRTEMEFFASFICTQVKEYSKKI